MRLVESTSGNLGVALAAIALLRGLAVTAVVDRNTTVANLDLLRVYGATVEVVSEPAGSGGYLQIRITRARQLAEIPGVVWINQYANRTRVLTTPWPARSSMRSTVPSTTWWPRS